MMLLSPMRCSLFCVLPVLFVSSKRPQPTHSVTYYLCAESLITFIILIILGYTFHVSTPTPGEPFQLKARSTFV
jgi:hypothetical protein